MINEIIKDCVVKDNTWVKRSVPSIGAGQVLGTASGPHKLCQYPQHVTARQTSHTGAFKAAAVVLLLRDGLLIASQPHCCSREMSCSRQIRKGLHAAPVGGRTFFTNMKIAFSGETFILLRMTYTNWPTVRSAGTRYLRHHQSIPCVIATKSLICHRAEDETEESLIDAD